METLTDERFDIVDRLGAGAMGVVFHARDRAHGGQDVALKVLKAFDPAALFRFKREFRTLADVVHPNLVSLYELVSINDQWMFTMELVDGVDFARYVRGPTYGADTLKSDERSSGVNGTGETVDVAVATAPPIIRAYPAGPDELDRLRRVLPQLADGVRAIHERGKLHRDLKPSNVLVDGSGRVVVMDFGIATGLAGSADMTVTRGVVGTPRYMAPEQAAAEDLTQACDWYAVGVMMYEVLAGRRPFEGDTDAVMAMKLAAPAPPIEDVWPDVPGDLRDLCNALLERDPAARPSGDDICAALGAERRSSSRPSARSDADAPPLVGRDRELGVLRDAFDAVSGGAGRVVHVRGHSGMGKTALVDAFLRPIGERDDVVVLRGRCFEQESVPYKALDSLIDALTAHMALLPDDDALALIPPDMTALVRLFPVLRRVEALVVTELGAAAPQDPVTLRRRAFVALRELLTRLGRRAPTVLYIDDLQWGDTESAGVLADVFRVGDEPPVLLVLSYRPEEDVSPFLRGFLDGRDKPTRVNVGRLPLASARELAALLLTSSGAASTALAESVARESGGSPFFVLELVRYVRAIQRAGEVLDDSLHVTLEEVLGERIDALADDVRQVLELVAVAAHPLAQSVALTAAGATSRDAPIIAQLRHEHLVRTSGVGSDSLVETAHDRVRETIVARLPPARRRDYHERIATALQARGNADPEAISAHLDAAGMTEGIVEYLLEAANNASDALAFDRAAALLSRALEHAPDDAPAREGMYVSLGEALGYAGRSAQAADAYLAAASLAGDDTSHDLRKQAAEHLLYSGEIDRGVQVLEGVLADVGVRAPRSHRAVMASLAWLRARLAVRGSRYRLKRVVATDEQRKVMEACWSAVIGFSMVDTMRSVEFSARHLLVALASGDPFHVSRGLTAEACLISLSGGRNLQKARRISARAVEIAEELGRGDALNWAHSGIGFVDYMNGEWAEARRTLRRGIELFTRHRTGFAWELSSMHMYEVWAMFYLGDLAEMDAQVRSLLRDARERGDLYSVTNLSTGLPALGWLARDQPEVVRRTVADAMAEWSPHSVHVQHYWATLAVVMADIYAGRADRAVKRIDEDWPTFRSAMFLRIMLVRNELMWLRAAAHLHCAESGDGAAKHVRAAARDARRMRGSEVAAYQHIGAAMAAGVAACQGDHGGARALLSEAIAGFDERGMTMHAACARHRLGDVAANDWMSRNQIEDPDRFARLISPGPFERG